jgi:hypothetical protein
MKFLKFLSCLLLLLPTLGNCLELGEPRLLSRLGEPLRLEIPLRGEAAETLGAHCFALTGSKSDLPAITRARLRLKGNGSTRRLVVDQGQAVNDPLFALALHIGCDINQEHELVLLPETPPTQEGKRSSAHAPAEAVAPNRTPRRSKPVKAQGDRLSLDIPAEPPVSSDPALAGVEERMLQLETSLHSLREELEQVDKLIALREEMLAAQKQRSAAMPLPIHPPASTPPPARSSLGDWLQLLAGILLGGAVSALVARRIDARRQTHLRA